VASCCERSDEPSSSCAPELVRGSLGRDSNPGPLKYERVLTTRPRRSEYYYNWTFVEGISLLTRTCLKLKKTIIVP
jgi:hypothetical protein